MLAYQENSAATISNLNPTVAPLAAHERITTLDSLRGVRCWASCLTSSASVCRKSMSTRVCMAALMAGTWSDARTAAQAAQLLVEQQRELTDEQAQAIAHWQSIEAWAKPDSHFLEQRIQSMHSDYRFGLGLFGQLERYQLYYVVATIWMLQIVGSSLWLKYFHFGPLEWLWRSLTYWRLQGFVRRIPNA